VLESRSPKKLRISQDGLQEGPWLQLLESDGSTTAAASMHLGRRCVPWPAGAQHTARVRGAKAGRGGKCGKEPGNPLLPLLSLLLLQLLVLFKIVIMLVI